MLRTFQMPLVNIRALLSASSTVALYPGHQYVFFSKLPKGACGGLMGMGWLSIFGGTSHELVRVEPDSAQ